MRCGRSRSKVARGHLPVNVPHRHVPSLFVVGLFIDSQSLVGDGAFVNLAMVEVWHLFRRASRRYWTWAAAAGFGVCRKF